MTSAAEPRADPVVGRVRKHRRADRPEFAAFGRSGYASRVRLPAYSRWIVLVALLCQVLAGTMAHVPAASAGPSEGMGMNCPDHVHAATSGDNAPRAHAQGHSGGETDTNGNGCKDGHCKCPCAYVPAVAADYSLPPAAIPHLPVMAVYVPPSLPLQPTVFFRPPI
jgi:hypothetical protein